MRFQILNTLLHCLAFYLGAGIGSFLNVVIYRLPLGISVNNPRRSFCPSCKYQIPMWQNIPLLSWLLLRGKCASCGSRISIRYFLVELLTGVMFYLVFLKITAEYSVGGNPWPLMQVWGPQVLCLWIFMSLLISGTFIDIDHFILPHTITIGGAVVGVLCSWWVPALMMEDTHTRGLLVSLASAAFGLGSLWAVVELEWKKLGSQQWVELSAVPQMHWYSLPMTTAKAIPAPQKATPLEDDIPPGITKNGKRGKSSEAKPAEPPPGIRKSSPDLPATIKRPLPAGR